MKQILHRTTFAWVLFLCSLLSAQAGPTLNSADLILIARNTDLDDQFALLALADIPGSSVIFLTDEGWDDSDFTFDGTEDVFQWTVHTNGITAGTIIRFTNESSMTLELMDSNHGTLTHVNGSSDMNMAAGDQLFFYQTDNDIYTGTIQRKDGAGGTEAGMIYAFNGDNSTPSANGWLDPNNPHTSSTSQVPDNMTALTTSDGSGNANSANANGMLTQADLKAVSANEYDNYRYDGPTTAAAKEDWLIRIHTTANWLASDNDTLGIFSGALTSHFTVSSPNIAPTISIDNTTLSYTENNPLTQIAAAATVSDADGDADWNDGTLVVQITANNEATDRLTIPDNVVGTINTSGINLQNGGTVIGTLSASEGTVTNGTALTITFNSNATNSLVQQVVRAIHYNSTSEDPGTANRTITVTVTDANLAVANDSRTVSVAKADNDAPALVTNNTLSLNEGATASVTTGSHLSATDVDDVDATLTYTITTTLSNGQLENTDYPGVSVSSFTQQHLTDGKIQYVHDGSNTTSDSFIFKVTDDMPNELTNQAFNISINAIDDDVATIVTNNGLTLNEGATATIGTGELESDDADTDNTTLTYTITTTLSNGQLKNTDYPGVSVSSFTQQHLADGKIQYVHDGSNTTSDNFTFKVADGTPNELTGQVFSISVKPVDDDAPTLIINSGLSLDMGTSQTITTTMLEADDADTDNATLSYTITAALVNGQLEDSDYPGVSVSSFTQQQLADEKIQYVHDGSNTTSDSFTFKVADGTSNELTGQIFDITVTGSTGFEKEKTGRSIQVYPNPASSLVHVVSGIQLEGATLLNLYGRRVAVDMQFDREGKLFINVSTLPKGNYLLQIQTKHGAITKKLMVH